jgi:hypothetical protein
MDFSNLLVNIRKGGLLAGMAARGLQKKTARSQGGDPQALKRDSILAA